MDSLTKFLEKRLRLKVNSEKIAVGFVQDRKFLERRLLAGGTLGIAPTSLKATKDKVRKIMKRNRGQALSTLVTELWQFLHGWVAGTTIIHAQVRTYFRDLDGWIEQKIRCYRLKQRK